MTHEGCPTDLLAKERRNELTVLERRKLSLHLVRCKTCRAWQQIGRDFDHEATAAIDDAAAVQRIANEIRFSSFSPLSRPVREKKARHAWTVKWFVLAAIASSAAATAAVAGWTISQYVPPPEVGQSITRNMAVRDPNPVAVRPGEQFARESTSPHEREDKAQTNVREGLALPATSTVASLPKATPTGASASPAGETALSLYREANQARRSGDASRAISLFRYLQQSFSRSPEAHLSNVALGGALLDSGAAREALEQFDRYLVTTGKKNLAAEAMYGRARALGALGNRAMERTAWEQLQAGFPRSPYSATATRRIHSLE